MNETRETMRRLRLYLAIIVALMIWGGFAPHSNDAHRAEAHSWPNSDHPKTGENPMNYNAAILEAAERI